MALSFWRQLTRLEKVVVRVLASATVHSFLKGSFPRAFVAAVKVKAGSRYDVFS